MTENFMDANSTLKLWDNLKNDNMAAVSNTSISKDLDYCFITPTLIGDLFIYLLFTSVVILAIYKKIEIFYLLATICIILYQV